MSPARPRPEILAPAGDAEALRAALAAGADAVYFGLDEGFNARARARNFPLERLAETVARIHRAGARAYLTLNTLVHEGELPAVEELLRRAAVAGVDAVIVQDPAVALLARAVCADLPIHASTQMTVSTPSAARFAVELGARRVNLPRELSVEEIARFRREAPPDLELEVFVHGALCLSWSGQCLASALLSGGRSANRGACAQPCRLPLRVLVDGEERPPGTTPPYPLSPRDLSAWRALPALIEAGVDGLKIEGRLKGAAYVATAVAAVRAWAGRASAGAEARATATPPVTTPASPPETPPAELRDLSLTFSRGFGDGFLLGRDAQTLVDGRCPEHRGLRLGEVVEVQARAAHGRPDRRERRGRRAPEHHPTGAVIVRPSRSAGAPPVELRPGMGVVFEGTVAAGRPARDAETGGPVWSVDRRPDGLLALGFGEPGPTLARVRPGHAVWVTGDPALERAARRLVEGPEPRGRTLVRLAVSGAAGEPLRVRATAAGRAADARSEAALVPAHGADGLTPALLAEKLGALGGTPLALAEAGLDATALGRGLHLPVSELKDLRRRLVAELVAAIERGPARVVADGLALPRLVAEAERRRAAEARPPAEASPPADPTPAAAPLLVALCRTPAHLEAAIAAGVAEVELDLAEPRALAAAVARARAAGLRALVATARVEKPGEEDAADRRLGGLAPDGVLVRSPGALVRLRDGRATAPHGGAWRLDLHGDFSLNAANALSIHHFLDLGLATVTPAADLPAAALEALLAAAPPGSLTIPLHRRAPAFHTEHCLFAHLLSDGRDARTCGRPCDRHRLALRDPAGRTLPVTADLACRNTIHDATPAGPPLPVAALLDAGARRFRVELLDEAQAEAERILGEAVRSLRAAA